MQLRDVQRFTAIFSNKMTRSELAFLFCLFSLPGQKNWTCHEYGRIGSNNNADNQGEGKVMDNTAAHNKKGDDHKKGGQGSQNGAAERFIDTAV